MTDNTHNIMMTADAGPGGLERRVPPTAAMGPLEFAQYKKDWRASYRFRAGVAHAAAERKFRQTATDLDNEVEAEHGDGALPRGAGSAKMGKTLRRLRKDEDQEENEPVSPAWKKRHSGDDHVVPPGQVAARLIFARIFDERPELLDAVRAAAPTVVIDVADAEMLDLVGRAWHDVLFDDPARLLELARDTQGRRARYDAILVLVKEPLKGKNKSDLATASLSALTLALPFFAFSPFGTTHLPQAVLDAARDRIEFPRLGPDTIARTIRIITGKPCLEAIDADIVAKTRVSDLIVAVRFDRSPLECVAELRRLAAAKETKKKSRDLTLSELYGLGEARAWAESAIADIKAWKAGLLP